MTAGARRRGFASFAHLFAVSAVLLTSEVSAKTYFVAIGSTHYVVAPFGTSAFSRLTGANGSARIVAARMARGGASGIVLTSTQDAFVTPADINQAIGAISTRIASARDENAFTVVYYAGHGISEGVGWNHFLVPGNFAYRGDAGHLGIEGLVATAVHTAALVDTLNKTKLPYVLILDTCSEGAEADFRSSILTGPAIDSLKGVAGILRFMNEFHQSSPVLFSTPPGTVVTTVKNPLNRNSENVGPLARRLMILLDPSLGAGQPISLKDVVLGLATPALDVATKPAITHAEATSDWSRVILNAAAEPGKIDNRAGTGTSASICCSAPQQEQAVPPRIVSGRIEVQGTPREFVSDGQSMVFTAPAYALTLSEAKGSVTIEATKDGDSWTIELSPPAGEKLRQKLYEKVGRFRFVEDRAGLSVTAPGRSCNDVDGRISIEDVRYNKAGKLELLKAGITQHCLEAAGHLDVRLSIDAAP